MSRRQLADAIARGAATLDQSLSAEAVDRLASLIDELERWNRRINLTAVREADAMVGAHVLDSLAARPYLHGRRIIDIGTGAGFPGLPLAIAEPERRFVLLDSNERKLSFVRHVITRLGLKNVSVVRARAEDYAPGERFDTVIARALASISRLTEYGGHLLQEGGVLLALKGKYPAEELHELPECWKYSVTELTVPGLEDRARHLVVLRRREE